MSLHQQTKLDPFIARLLQSTYYGVRVTDADTGTPLAANKTAADMVRDFGSIEAFFNDLYTNRGVKNIIIQGRKKNGSSWKPDGDPEKIGFEPVEEPQPAPTHQAPPPAQDFQLPGLTGGLMQGLNAQMVYHHMDYPKILAENVAYKAETASLKKEIETLKHDALETKFSEAKATGNRDMLLGIGQMLAPLLQAFAASKMGGGAPEAIGLGNPPGGMSQTKQELMGAISHAPDNICEYLYAIIEGLNLSPEFVKELEALLIKHELITNDNA
jgi:hypothetical protein